MTTQITFGDVYQFFGVEVCNVEWFDSSIIISKYLPSAVNSPHYVEETSGVLTCPI